MSKQAYEFLEDELALWCGNPNTIVCSSGTSALHLALEAMKLPLGSEVLVPDFTMIACARAVSMAGLVPVFVDCGDDLLIRPDNLKWHITDNTRAIMPVHVYGRRCDMQAIQEVADSRGLLIVEDLAEAHGVPPWSRAFASCWSFYQNKIVAGEEGGAIAFLRCEDAEYAKCLRSQGFTPAHDFTHIPRGVNARLSNANAELIRKSLADIESNLETRKLLAEHFDYLLGGKFQIPFPRQVNWVYDIRGNNFSSLVPKLHAKGFTGVRNSFKPCSLQEEYRNGAATLHSNANSSYLDVIYLPLNMINGFDYMHSLVKDLTLLAGDL